MLQDFWKLNEPFKVLEKESDLLDQLEISKHLQNLLFQPNRFAPPRPKNRIREKVFENVSFAKTVFDGIEFHNCSFVDCLFIGAEFVNCQFHRCKFEGVNPYKASFNNTYIDPEVFAKTLQPKSHANIGVGLFQQLYANASTTHQPRFASSAEFHFKKWERYQLRHDRKHGHLTKWQWFVRAAPNFLYQYCAGYGLRAKYFAGWTIGMLAVVVLFNYWQWDHLAVLNGQHVVTVGSPIDAFYFSMVTIATVGFGDFVPTSQFGRGVIAVQSLFGVVWLALFAATLVKKVVR